MSPSGGAADAKTVPVTPAPGVVDAKTVPVTPAPGARASLTPAPGGRASLAPALGAPPDEEAAVESGEPEWLAQYDFELPEDRIARTPLEPRDSSRLLVLDRKSGDLRHRRFFELPELLEPGDCLVVNETRVLCARLLTRLARTGRKVEMLLSHPCVDIAPDDASALASHTRSVAGDGASARAGEWVAILGRSRNLRAGDVLQVEPEAGSFEIIARIDRERWRVRPDADPIAMMERAGHLPIPPYLQREDREEDRNWYQTVFASEAGAIAAPTAGLHFTQAVLDRAGERGITIARIVLHVGPGTFLPVRAATEEEHRVLPERYSISGEATQLMNAARAGGHRVIAVGTTVVRALESAARGAEPAMGGGTMMQPSEGWTDLTIVPGHHFRAIDGLVTNFHLPRSSLLLLVSAWVGRDRILTAYRDAIDRGYRFYSYGDAMLIV